MMNFLGDYKLNKMLTMNSETEKTEFADPATVYARMEAAGEDPRELRQMQMQIDTVMTVTEGELIYRLPIPADAPKDEIEKMEKAGMIKDGMVEYERTPAKIEDSALYMYDRSTFLAGTEWVKISTDVEGELNLIMAIWKKA